jgi:DDE superfamily endonuclease
MYRLCPEDFDRLLSVIEGDLEPRGPGAKYLIPSTIKLCVALRFLAGGIFLDLSFGYEVPINHIHTYVWQVLEAIDRSDDPFLDNIQFPIDDVEKLNELERGFARYSSGRIRGTVAAGDGVVFPMYMPTNEEVGGDVVAYFTRKGYYAYGLQAFCDSYCKFVVIASKVCSSCGDNTSYIVTKMSKDIKSGKLPPQFHVVLDEAYPRTEQEMSPWKGRSLSEEKDAFNYYLSLNRQGIERAFGLLVQRWGVFWRPLRVSMEHRGLLIRVACKLHNRCIDRFKLARPDVCNRRVPEDTFG